TPTVSTAIPPISTAPLPLSSAITPSAHHQALSELHERYETLLYESGREAWRHIDSLALQLEKLQGELQSEYRRAQGLALQLEQERDKLLCLVCQERGREVVFLPCTHLCVCSPCAKQIAADYQQVSNTFFWLFYSEYTHVFFIYWVRRLVGDAPPLEGSCACA
ncbi:RING-HC finger protein, partial [archaeon]